MNWDTSIFDIKIPSTYSPVQRNDIVFNGPLKLVDGQERYEEGFRDRWKSIWKLDVKYVNGKPYFPRDERPPPPGFVRSCDKETCSTVGFDYSPPPGILPRPFTGFGFIPEYVEDDDTGYYFRDLPCEEEEEEDEYEEEESVYDEVLDFPCVATSDEFSGLRYDVMAQQGFVVHDMDLFDELFQAKQSVVSYRFCGMDIGVPEVTGEDPSLIPGVASEISDDRGVERVEESYETREKKDMDGDVSVVVEVFPDLSGEDQVYVGDEVPGFEVFGKDDTVFLEKFRDGQVIGEVVVWSDLWPPGLEQVEDLGYLADEERGRTFDDDNPVVVGERQELICGTIREALVEQGSFGDSDDDVGPLWPPGLELVEDLGYLADEEREMTFDDDNPVVVGEIQEMICGIIQESRSEQGSFGDGDDDIGHDSFSVGFVDLKSSLEDNIYRNKNGVGSEDIWVFNDYNDIVMFYKKKVGLDDYNAYKVGDNFSGKIISVGCVLYDYLIELNKSVYVYDDDGHQVLVCDDSYDDVESVSDYSDLDCYG